MSDIIVDKIILTSSFLKGYKELQRDNRIAELNTLDEILLNLEKGTLGKQFKNHSVGKKTGDVHISGDVVLIYRYLTENVVMFVLELSDISDHKNLSASIDKAQKGKHSIKKEIYTNGREMRMSDIAKKESLNERNLTKAERHNRNMNKIFAAKKEQDEKAKEFLKKKGYEEKTIKELEDKDELSKEIVDVFGADKWGEILKDNNESLNEALDEDERRTALAKYLNAPVDTITRGYRDEVFETEDGEEYFVVDEDEARQLAIEDAENFIEEVGITGFTESFQEWIFDNAVKKDWFEYVLDEYNDSYIYDITLEEARDDRYPSRLVEEAVEAGIISEEEGENFDMSSDEKYDLQDKYKTYLNDQVDDPIQWYRDMVGDRDFNETIVENGLTDDYAIAEEEVDVDGIAHFLASYDGEEIELDNGLFAYRIN